MLPFAFIVQLRVPVARIMAVSAVSYFPEITFTSSTAPALVHKNPSIITPVITIHKNLRIFFTPFLINSNK